MSVLWLKGGVPKIDKLSDATLRKMLERITPVVEQDGKLITVDVSKCTLWNTAFLWTPTFGEAICDELYELAIIETFHTCGYIGFFKPSLGEVLSQIPKHLRDEVSHFQTFTDETHVGCFMDGDGHRTITKLYTRLSMDARIAIMRGKATPDTLSVR